jgi:hypothetical protein
MTNAFTPSTVDIAIHDLDRHPRQPLVLLDMPLAEQLQPIDAKPSDLYIYELSPWLPHPRNSPFTYQRLETYIERNYLPSPTTVSGFRIWYPKSCPQTNPPRHTPAGKSMLGYRLVSKYTIR